MVFTWFALVMSIDFTGDSHQGGESAGGDAGFGGG